MKASIAQKFNLAPNYANRIYRGGAYNTFMQDLQGAIANNGFLSLCGNIGAGKTTLWNDMSRTLENRVQIVRVRSLDKEELRINSIVNALVFDLSNESPRHNFEARSRQANRLLGEKVIHQGKQVCLIIENAHRLHWKTILSLKELREMEFAGHSPLFGIVLIGQMPLLSKIERIKEIYLRMDFIVMDASAGWMDEAERQNYLKFIYGDLLTAKMRAKIAFLNDTPQEMNFLVETKLEQAYYAGRDRLEEADFEIGMKDLKDKLGLSYREIGKLSGHDRSTVAKIIQGQKQNPEIQAAIQAALEKAAERKKEYKKAVNY